MFKQNPQDSIHKRNNTLSVTRRSLWKCFSKFNNAYDDCSFYGIILFKTFAFINFL